MQENFRLEKGGLINRSKKISFKFNGKKYYGYEGDTIASALLANGVHLVGRSFKYHRPRGFFGAGVDESLRQREGRLAEWRGNDHRRYAQLPGI